MVWRKALVPSGDKHFVPLVASYIHNNPITSRIVHDLLPISNVPTLAQTFQLCSTMVGLDACYIPVGTS